MPRGCVFWPTGGVRAWALMFWGELLSGGISPSFPLEAVGEVAERKQKRAGRVKIALSNINKVRWPEQLLEN
ncbi:hypothetical protein B9Z19DRAFT_706186 [Tuber borchii]|uniref:Uncharacterized protein n=1 Tax=Tuber borchii TaxID=42251 RepID=A0A2T7A819_TUBBO|nr:hypothetical protein B9Z19DRAFT_706186 [Tuber borchii]